jgi:hypothetical protein
VINNLAPPIHRSRTLIGATSASLPAGVLARHAR